MRPRRILVAAVALLCAAATLVGCVVRGCPGWAGYETPEDAADSADAVVVGRVVERVSTTDFNGASANVWSVDVAEWIKGEGPDRIEVISPPPACGPGTDPYLGEEDPLATATGYGTAALFLVGDEPGWRALSPGQGLVEVAPDGQIPTDWPAP
jgi:hypothetical protein